MARCFINPSADEAHGFLDEDDDVLDGEEDEVGPIDLLNFGLCPHGVPDDGECDECPGGPAGWDDEAGW